jgi:hypothetical protein
MSEGAGFSGSARISKSGTSRARVRRRFSRFSALVRRSACRRELVNTRVERWARTSPSTARWTCGQMVPDTSSSSVASAGGSIASRSSTGRVTDRSQALVLGGRTTRTGRGRSVPVRKSATSSAGSTVADRPMRWGTTAGAGVGPSPVAAARTSASNRARDRARWTPRLVPATAWTSSTITVRTSVRVERAWDPSMRNKDSGVVMSTSGGWVISRRLSAGGVSPLRSPTVSGRWGIPRRSATRCVPTNGEVRLRPTSTPRAFNGEM